MTGDEPPVDLTEPPHTDADAPPAELATRPTPKRAGSNGHQPEPSDDLLLALLQIHAHRAMGGGAFIFGEQAEIASVWGRGQEVLWAQGEALFLVGPAGVGKSSVCQQSTLGRIGLRDDVLGYPVIDDGRRVLILALDRPRQIARSLHRMVPETDAALLDERITVWRGPLPFNLLKEPYGFIKMADHFKAGTIICDSLKDLAPNISNEETGSLLNSAIQIALAEGVDFAGVHHQRKATSDNRKPTTLADVYGSQMLVNGAGSVLLVWGEAGDLVVEASHLKQPAEQVGPLTLIHDHQHGVTTVEHQADTAAILKGSLNGITAQGLAAIIFSTTTPTRNQVEKARRRLERFVTNRQATRTDGQKGGADGGQTTLYYPV